MAAPVDRLLQALDRRALLRVATAYSAVGRGFVETGDLRRRLARLEELDLAEVVRFVLARDELVSLAQALGLPDGGTRSQLGTRLARALRWRPFEEARDLARSLGLPSVRAWRAWVWRERPKDVPPQADAAYAGLGWQGWGDFLGTGRLGTRGRTFRSFQAARAFARRLGLKSSADWHAWCAGKRPDLPARPPDVPVIPHRTYKGTWQGMGDWLGTGTVQTQRREFLPFAAARRFVRSLGLRNQGEYFAWLRGQRPELARSPGALPAHPPRTYADRWGGWGDFLGTGSVHPRVVSAGFLPFAKARAFARTLGLRSMAEWHRWAKGAMPGKPPRPPSIPTNPNKVYAERGWRGFGDWLGTGRLEPGAVAPWPFRRARAFVRALGLRSATEWEAWRKGALPGKPARPPQVPTNPWRTYAQEWTTIADWLGKPPGKRRRWRPFEEARALARGLALDSPREWKAYAAGRRADLPPKPADVPSNPAQVYAEQGWSGFPDWLGRPRRRSGPRPAADHVAR